MEVGQAERREQAGGGSVSNRLRSTRPPKQYQVRGWSKSTHHDAREVDVCHHQHVELAEQGELVQRPRCLAVCLASLP